MSLEPIYYPEVNGVCVELQGAVIGDNCSKQGGQRIAHPSAEQEPLSLYSVVCWGGAAMTLAAELSHLNICSIKTHHGTLTQSAGSL